MCDCLCMYCGRGDIYVCMLCVRVSYVMSRDSMSGATGRARAIGVRYVCDDVRAGMVR